MKTTEFCAVCNREPATIKLRVLGKLWKLCSRKCGHTILERDFDRQQTEELHPSDPDPKAKNSEDPEHKLVRFK